MSSPLALTKVCAALAKQIGLPRSWQERHVRTLVHLPGQVISEHLRQIRQQLKLACRPALLGVCAEQRAELWVLEDVGDLEIAMLGRDDLGV